VCLFDEGVLVHNTRELDAQVATWSMPRWARHNLPSSAETPTEETWDLWAERVEHYLQRITAVVKPDKFIIAGRASAPEYYSEWAHRMSKVSVPVYCAQKGLMAAVQGAAIGGSELLNLRYDLARVRSALGHKRGLSPQKVTDQMLVDVFTEFDADNSGSISVEEIAATIKSLGVKMSQRELKEMLVDMDYDGSGEISIEEFVRWWKESVQGNAVEVIHTMAEYEQVLED